MRRKTGLCWLLLFAAVLLFCPAGVKAAAKKTGWQPVARYYYYQSDGTLLKKTGLQVINGKTYFLAKDYSRCTGQVKIKGKLYFFQKNGVRYEKTGWKTVAGKQYYFQEDHSLAVGAKKIGKKWYYFSATGVMQKNSLPFLYKGKYYRTDADGICYKITDLEAEASKATWKFINRYSSKTDSKTERFRSCFKRLLGYMHYRPGYIKISELSGKGWQYRCALKVFNNNVTGNCYGFACTVAACAKELGFEPYVVALTCDHAVVTINGKYYDNMGGGKFGASAPYVKNFKIYKKVKY